MNKSILFASTNFTKLTNFTQTSWYSGRVKNILRNRYPYRNDDGTFKEFNESVTIVPKEFEQQGD